MPETKIILTLEDQQFVKEVRACIGDAVQLQEALKKAGKIEVKGATGSIQDLTTRVNEARRQLEASLPGTTAYENALKRVEVVSGHLDKAQSNVAARLRGQLNPAAGQASYVMMNLGRGIQDLPYGFLGIANNITLVAEGMAGLIKTTGGVKAALVGMGQSLIGPMGIIMAINLVVSAISMYMMWAGKGEKATEKWKDSVDKLKSSLDRMSKATLEAQKNAEEALIKQLEKKRDEVVIKTNVKAAGGTAVVERYESRKGLSEDEKAQLDAAKERLGLIKNEIKNLGIIDNAERALREKEQAWRSAKTTEEMNAAERVYNNAQTEYDLLTKKGKLTQDIYKQGADSLEDIDRAIRIMEGDTRTQIKQIDEAIVELKATQEKVKDARKQIKIEEMIKELEGKRIKLVAELRFEEITGERKDVFNFIRQKFENAGIIFNEQLKKYAISISMKFEPMSEADVKKEVDRIFGRVATARQTGANVDEQGYMKPVQPYEISEGTKKSLEPTNKELEDMYFNTNMVRNAFEQAGSSIVDAMFGAKMSIKDVLTEVSKLIAKTLLLKAIEAGLNYLLPGAGTAAEAVATVASRKEGGLINIDGPVTKVALSVFRNAQAYATGGITPASGVSGIPAILHPEEMVLNKQQQRNLFNMIAEGKGISYAPQTQTIEVVGNIRANQTEFYVELKRLEKKVERMISGRGFVRSNS